MGTRADFYVGRGKSAEWLGSIAMDGYPDGQPENPEHGEPVVKAATEEQFRKSVSALIAGCGHGTTPDQGWPWPWDDSNLTDFSYAFDAGQLWITCFGHGWKMISDPPDDAEEAPKISDWPDMSSRKNVTMGRRSGLLVLVGPATN